MATRVGALWIRKYKDKQTGQEKTLISGSTEYVMIPPKASIILNKNTDKKKENSPDFFLTVEEPYEKRQTQQGYGGGNDYENGDIPF